MYTPPWTTLWQHTSRVSEWRPEPNILPRPIRELSPDTLDDTGGDHYSNCPAQIPPAPANKKPIRQESTTAVKDKKRKKREKDAVNV